MKQKISRHFLSLLALAACISCASSAVATVTITSPTSAATTTSPVHFVASATSSHPIAAMRIYVDNVSIYTVAAASLNTQITMAPGAHYIVVQAWNSSGTVYRSAENITVSSAAAVHVSVSPASAVLQAAGTQQFTASVSGSSNTAVTWRVNGIAGGNASVGTISASGMYTAPATIAANTAISLTATSTADTTKSAAASVTLMPAATSVSVSITPQSASLAAGQTKQFNATVSGTSNSAVNWMVNGVSGGNATTGTVSGSGVFSSPSCPSSSSATVTAVSSYDASASASATVSIGGAASASAGAFYVSNSGNDSNDGSSCHPLATLSAASSKVVAGNVVHVAAGTYNEQLLVHASGTAAAHIQFVCDSYRQCKIVGRGYNSGYGSSAVVFTGAYVDLMNFDISTDASGAGGFFGYGSGYYQIVGNYVHDIPVPDCNGNGGGGIDPEATGSGGHSYVALNAVSNIGNATTCGRANGIYLSGNGTTAVNNLVYNTWGSGFDVAHDAVNVIVAFNTVNGVKRGNNVGGDGVYLGCDSSACNSNIIVNNILSNNANAGIESYQGDSGDPASSDVFDNNLFYGNGAPCSFPGGSVGLSCTNSKSGNPMFTTAGSDFRLLTGSAAIGAASTRNAPSSDYAGKSRTAPSDIGAYQH